MMLPFLLTAAPPPLPPRLLLQQDVLGKYERLRFTWGDRNGAVLMVTEFRVYSALVVFAQEFPVELKNTSTYRGPPTPCTDQSCPGVATTVSSFPTLSIALTEERNYLNYRGYDLDQVSSTSFGRWREPLAFCTECN
jgi:hypothetical protein